MPAPFPTWSNHAFRLSIATTVALIFGSVLLLMAWVRSPWNTGEQRSRGQPVLFDHRHHVSDDGIDCLYCHDLADRSRYAGIPGAGKCMNCHNQIWDRSPALEPVRQSYFRGITLAWNQVYALPDFVYFDHSQHVLNGVGCEECHGRVDRQPRIVQVAPLTMSWCLACHRDPAPHLRPLDQVTTMGWTFRGDRDSLAAALAADYDVRSKMSCTTCHR